MIDPHAHLQALYSTDAAGCLDGSRQRSGNLCLHLFGPRGDRPDLVVYQTQHWPGYPLVYLAGLFAGRFAGRLAGEDIRRSQRHLRRFDARIRQDGAFQLPPCPWDRCYGICFAPRWGQLGPEAPLADACGGIGTWASDKLKLDEKETRTVAFGGLSGMLAAFITNPFAGALLGLELSQGGMSGAMLYFWALFPSLLASSVSTIVFVLLSGTFFKSVYHFPTYLPQLADLFFAAPLGMLGGVVGVLFMLSLKRLQRLFEAMGGHVVVLGLIGGLGMGIIGAFFPLTLFSGEEQTFELVVNAAEIGVGMLIVLAIAKLFATSLLLSTGWKGGYIFPIMFASVAMGMALGLLFPGIRSR